MGLIKCTKCGNDISEHARQCPHCGSKVEHGFPCKDCGTMVKRDDISCPHCGCPLSKQGNVTVADVAFSKSRTAWNKIKTHRKKIVLIGLIIIAAIIGFSILYQYCNQIIPEEYESVAAETGEDILQLSGDVFSVGIYVYTGLCEVEKGTQQESDLLGENKSTYTKEIKRINEENKKIQKNMKALSNPPSEYEDIYDGICLLYEDFNYLYSLTTDPPISSSSFSEKANDSAYKIEKSYEEFQELFSSSENKV